MNRRRDLVGPAGVDSEPVFTCEGRYARVSFQVVFPDFPSLPNIPGFSISSPRVASRGRMWWMDVYPGGVDTRHAREYVSCYLRLDTRIATVVSYSITLLAPACATKVGRTYSSSYRFVSAESSARTFLGSDVFIRKANLLREYCSDQAVTFSVQICIFDGVEHFIERIPVRPFSSSLPAPPPPPAFQPPPSPSPSPSLSSSTSSPLSPQRAQHPNPWPASTQALDPSIARPCTTHLLFSEEYSDVELLVAASSTRIAAHKCILCTQSEVFKSMFEQAMEESLCNRVTIVGFCEAAVREMLRFLYTQECSALAMQDQAAELLSIACMYQVPSMLHYVEDHLLRYLRLENVLQVLEMPETSACPRLRAQGLRLLASSLKSFAGRKDVLALLSKEDCVEVLDVLASSV